jgi:hypothetical protein
MEVERSSGSVNLDEGHLFDLKGLFLARSERGANFRFGQEHRTFLSVNEFYYLTQSSLSCWNIRSLGSHNSHVTFLSAPQSFGGVP